MKKLYNEPAAIIYKELADVVTMSAGDEYTDDTFERS